MTMDHVHEQIDEYIRGRLPDEEARAVAAHLVVCPLCRAEAEWVGRLAGLARQAHPELPDEVWATLQERLLAIPERFPATRTTRLRLPDPRAWSPSTFALVRAAAMVILGVLVGYGLWGRPARLPVADSPFGLMAKGRDSAPAAQAPTPSRYPVPTDLPAAVEGTAAAAGTGGEVIEALEARIQALERTIYANHFARVEATMIQFMSSASEGRLTEFPSGFAQDLLLVTSNLKAERKSADDIRMVRLFGQIESVLMEMDRLSRERDLTGARRMVSVIEQQGLLPALQRLKVGIDE